MKKRKILPFLAGSLLLTLGLAACGSNGGNSNGGNGGATSSVVDDEEEKIVVTSADNKKEIIVGETLQLSASVEGVSWSTRDTDFVSVSDTGLVTALKAGTAKVTAKKDGYANGSITITINKAPEKKADYELRLEEAEHYDPDDFWGADYSQWGMGIMGPGDSPVEDNSGATDDGTSLGWLQAGCKETMTFTSDKAAEVEIGVTMAYNAVMPLEGVLKVTFNGTELSMAGLEVPGPEEEGSYYEFHAVMFGKVQLKAGNNVLEIEMLAQGPNMDKVVINTTEKLDIKSVPAKVKETITVKAAKLTVEEGSTVQIESEVTGLTYVSSNAEVATVSASGLVTGVKPGNATITLSKDGWKDAKVEITVTKKPVAGQIELEAEDAELGGPAQVESKSGASGGKSVGYLSADASITFKFNAEAGTYKFEMNCGSGNANWSTWPNVMADSQELTDELMPVTVNGVAHSVNGITIPGGSANNPVDWFIVNLGNVTLKEGANEIVFSFTAQGPNIDYIQLTKI
ncbi:MAG: Ig-like domain-containing protein [Bacilli bacterium]|nr:Ig-like domain-containing protein [Bacilli bacterium]